MKKISLLMCAVASLGILFTSCEKKQNTETPIDPNTLLTSGAYVVGEATGYADLKAEGVVATGMATGLNEKTGETREGMFEKYIVLEANKDFQIVFKEGNTYTYYGANLEAAKLATDGQELDGWKGALKQDAKMKVGATGFYHIILDFNKDELLNGTGGAQIVVAPVEWGIAGSMNGWGYTAADAQPTVQAKQSEITWSWTDVEFQANAEFKFKHSAVWKIFLDDAQQVSANTNLGTGMVPNGANMVVENGGLYKIVLTYKMAKGDIAASYSYIMERTGDAAELNPADFVVGISGSMQGWSTPEGTSLAKYNADESNVADAKTKAGVYVYNITGLTFPENSTFKFRMDGDWLGFGAVEIVGVNATEAESDQNFTGVVGTYNIKITIEWDGAARKSYRAEFTEGEAVEMVKGMVYVLNETGIEAANLNIYGYGGSELFGGWPGKAYDGTTIKDNYIGFEYEAVKDAEYRFIINDGNGWQTSDMADGIIVTGQEIYLNASAEKTLTIIK